MEFVLLAVGYFCLWLVGAKVYSFATGKTVEILDVAWKGFLWTLVPLLAVGFVWVLYISIF